MRQLKVLFFAAAILLAGLSAAFAQTPRMFSYQGLALDASTGKPITNGPHSVTVNCISYNGQLYLTSVYPAGARTRSWNDNVMRDPHVRIKIGDQLYDRTLALVTDAAEQEGVLQARHKKYPELKVPANATIHVFHVVG